MIEVAVLAPVLNRPERLAPLIESVAATAKHFVMTVYVIVNSDDKGMKSKFSELVRTRLTRGEARLLSMPGTRESGDYARKINFGFKRTTEEYVFLGADDLRFHMGWIERALATQAETNACVVGTNDLGNNRTIEGTHSTHTLVHREYVKCGPVWDDPTSGKLLFEGYDHNFCDTEFVETAKHRGTFAHATDSIVEHLHPFWDKAPKDSVYALGQTKFFEDQRLYQQRAARMWAA